MGEIDGAVGQPSCQKGQEGAQGPGPPADPQTGYHQEAAEVQNAGEQIGKEHDEEETLHPCPGHQEGHQGDIHKEKEQ